MINLRIKLLLDPQFILFSSECYQQALDSKRIYDGLTENQRKDVDLYRRGVDYVQTAVDLINVEFKELRLEQKLGKIDLSDLVRSWRIVNRLEAVDPLGLSYMWFITRISLYVPDRKGYVHRPLPSNLKRTDIIDYLLQQFLSWAEVNNRLGALSPSPENPAFIDEIEGLFVSTIDVLTDSNTYVQQIFKNTEIECEMVPSVLNEDVEAVVTNRFSLT